MADQDKDRVIQLIQAPLEAEGCELADIALSRYRTSVTLRVFVYSAQGPTLEQCTRLSRAIGDVIDGTELFGKGYTLEVSSPGLDRPLQSARDFKYRIGETVRVLFADPKRKHVTAQIVAAADDQVEFRDDLGGTFSVPLVDIAKAKIVF
ncbi:MAG: hypothetical protein AB1644_08010 [Candidatus Zixiibacteriota bacterium]